MQTCPTPIVIVSGSDNHNELGAGFRAIEEGALVVVRRPFGPGHAEHHETALALTRTVKSMAEVKVVRRWAQVSQRQERMLGADARDTERPLRRLVVLGASTGGPAVLKDILCTLAPDYPLPIVIVQHMAAGFVDGFAQWLTVATGIPVGIAQDGARLAAGHAYLAPDGFQMGITRDLCVALSTALPEHGMRPSVSFLFRSIHKDVCRGTAAVLLTGMGKDGARELKLLKENGAITIVQDRATAAVYGMPGEALKHDAARLVLDPAAIGKTLRSFGHNNGAELPLVGL
jgi:two-component system chemotaxis response regulator CheB